MFGCKTDKIQRQRHSFVSAVLLLFKSKKVYNILTMTDIEKQVEKICGNHEELNNFIYTPIDEAIKELEKRRKDEKLEKKIIELLGDNIPKPFQNKEKFVLARHLVTPNYEVSRFLTMADAFEFDPLFFEYNDDKLIYKNPWKYSLGKIRFYSGKGKKGGMKIDNVDVIDFNNSHGKKISSINTKWEQSLVDFHHEFFCNRFPKFKNSIFDASDWYSNNGGNPESFYEKFLTLFIRHGILFENFLLDETELEFTKKIILPAIINISSKLGLKPLIVALEPTDIEGDGFWLCHPACTSEFVDKKLLS